MKNSHWEKEDKILKKELKTFCLILFDKIPMFWIYIHNIKDSY